MEAAQLWDVRTSSFFSQKASLGLLLLMYCYLFLLFLCFFSYIYIYIYIYVCIYIYIYTHVYFLFLNVFLVFLFFRLFCFYILSQDPGDLLPVAAGRALAHRGGRVPSMLWHTVRHIICHMLWHMLSQLCYAYVMAYVMQYYMAYVMAYCYRGGRVPMYGFVMAVCEGRGVQQGCGIQKQAYVDPLPS